MMPPCQDTSVNVKHDGSGRHRGKGPGEAAICPLSLKHLGHVLFCARNVGQRSTKSAEDPFRCPPMAGFGCPPRPDGQVLNIDFYPRRRVNCVGPARLLLNVEDATKLAQFLGEAVESRPPVANIEHGVLVCECGHRGTPRLEESGYQVSHVLVEIVGDTIIASGWDGSSRAVSEEGDAYWLMCDGCGKLHPLPPELHID
jgi:hypothetical protein